MKNLLLLSLTLCLVIACTDDKPEVTPTPTPVVATPTPVVATPTPNPSSEYCKAEGKTIECEAQFAMSLNCRKADNSDYAPAYFKDVAELDAYGKAKGVGFKMGPRESRVYYGASQGEWNWNCHFIN